MNLKQIVAGLALLVALVLSALAGVGVPASSGSGIHPAYADCDNHVPPGGMDPCAPTPTPTPLHG